MSPHPAKQISPAKLRVQLVSLLAREDDVQASFMCTVTVQRLCVFLVLYHHGPMTGRQLGDAVRDLEAESEFPALRRLKYGRAAYMKMYDLEQMGILRRIHRERRALFQLTRSTRRALAKAIAACGSGP